jgi:hypothetical protein
VEWLEVRTLFSASSLAAAVPVAPGALTVVSQSQAGVTDLSPVDAGQRTDTAGTLLGPDQVDTYPFTVSTTVGSGELTAELAATGGTLLPRLTLAGPDGRVLIQSDSGRIVQYLRPGTYSLAVSAQAGVGGYRLTTAFAAASPLLAPLATGPSPKSVAVGDFNGDGFLDLVAPNFLDNTVSVFLGNGDGTFGPQEVIPAGNFPVSVTVADVNGDGKPDLLIANKGNASVSVLLGNGDGSFQPERTFAVGRRPGGVAVADVNGDGKLDLAVSNYRDGTVSVLLGNGDGTFQAQQTYTVGSGPGKVEAADLNGDGIPDLITPNYADATASVLLGRGDGTFRPQLTFAVGRSPYEVAVADFNGDGRPDLAVSNYADSDVSVLLGRGNGTFAPQQTFATAFEPYAVVAADVNGDGRPDLVTANWGDNSVSVLLGKGDGSFQPQQTFPVGKNPHVVAVGDFNGDGVPDLVTPNKSDNSLSVLLGNGDGSFQAQQAAPAPAPGLRPFSVAVADLNGDGRPDLVTANKGDDSVGVLLANSDGTFATRETFPAGTTPNFIVAADVNGDGKPDLVIANYDGASVSVLLGNGDGTFQAPQSFAAGNSVYAVAVADLNGDGKVDLVTANKGDQTVGVLMGNGDGTFQPMQTFPAGPGVDAVTVADVNGDGILDLVTGNFGDGTVSVLLGKGDGTFRPQQTFLAGANPSLVAVADVNGDGKPDLVVSNYGDSTVSVLLGNGDGSFRPQHTFVTGTNPNAVAVADVNGDGKPDLITANYGSGSVSVLPGNGDGTFGSPQSFLAGRGACALAVADIDRDGHLDLAVANRNDNSVSLLPGNGDGSFRPAERLGLGKNRYAVAVGDVNGDGKPDLVTTSVRNGTATVQLGDGTGTFQQGQTLAVGPGPTSVAVADLNGDGRLDLVTTSSDGNSVSVLLGNGDGTFHAGQLFAVGRSPRAVVVADVNGDGIPDLVVTNYNDATVSVLLGKGDGTFQPQQVFAVGQRPYALAVADVNGDGIPDLVVANAAGDTVSVLAGNGDGTFRTQQTFAVGRQPVGVALTDVNGDGILDVVVANAADNTISVLTGDGDGTFQPQRTFAAGTHPFSVEAADVNGDGKTDLVTADYGGDGVSVLLGNGAGAFQEATGLATGQFPVQTVIGDVNGDGRPDLVTMSNHDSTAGVLLGNGDGSFQPATAAGGVPLRDKPLLVDVNGDGIPDSIVLDRSGNILFRKGLAGGTNSFAPPVILNPGRPARDITVLRTGSGLAVAAADAHFDPALSADHFVFSVSLYTVGPGGGVGRTTAFSTTALPARLAAADLTGNGLDDLVAANPLDNSVTIALQTAPGQFAAPVTVPVGAAPSDIAVADTNGDGLPDVVVSDQASGDVSVLLNDAAHSFARSLRFRAGTEPGGLDTTSGGLAVSSLAQSVSLVAGDFTGHGRSDLVVVNRGAHSFTILAADGHGGFANPQRGLTTSTSDGFIINGKPGAVVAGDFNRDGRLDLAVLMEDTGQVWIYTGHGDGTFTHTFTIPVGDQATGLSVVPGGGAGLLDLLVGNGFGDVLHLEGKGDGTFQISGNRVSLAVVPDLLGPGQPGVLVGNQQDNHVTVQGPSSSGTGFTPVQTLEAATPSGQLAPGDVAWFLLDRNATLPDAVVVSSGSNAVVVYRTTAASNGVVAFAPTPQTYFVGTAPAGVTVADVNGDGIPDMLVANQGSNDVSVLFGSFDAGGHWVGTPGPRLKSGGDGPIAVTVRDLTHDGIPDLVVTNGGSGTITLLPGVGQGFFDDQDPRTLFDLGDAVVQPPTFVGGSDIGFAVTAGGDLARFDLGNPGAGPGMVLSGQDVLAARALDGGQVVVALAGGAVKVLTPAGSGLNVAAELQARGGVPALPSSLEVLQTGSGPPEVLVSSRGSDTIFVFALAFAPPLPPSGEVAQPVPGGLPGSGVVAQPGRTGPTGSAAPLQVIIALATGSATSTLGVTESTSASGTLSTGLLSAALGSTTGLSLSGLLSPNTSSGTADSAAVLVPIQGNAYSAVAVLDFGSGNEDEAAGGGGRMPWLSTSYPLGDTSPLTRFVTGHEEALRDYRDSEGTRLPEDSETPPNDPWEEDLFHPRQPSQRPATDSGEDEPLDEAWPESLLPVPHQDPMPDDPAFCADFWGSCGDTPLLLPSVAVARNAAEFEALTVLLAGLLLAQAQEPPDGRANRHVCP